MDDHDFHRLRDSSIAAALNALVPTGEPDSEFRPDDPTHLLADFDTQINAAVAPEDSVTHRIQEACRALAHAGVRPRPKGVSAYLKDKHGASPDPEEVTLIVRRWKAAQWKSDAVRAAYLAYARLDAEQRAAFQSRIDVDRQGAITSAAEERTMTDPFVIRMHLRDGSTRTDTADRATTAWVKFQNRVDRRQPNHVSIDLVDRSSGVEKIIQRCKFGSANAPTSNSSNGGITDWA